MKFAHLSHKLYGQPLMLLPSTFEHLSQALTSHMQGGGNVVQMQGMDVTPHVAATSAQLGRLAVVSMSGVIDRNLSMMDALCTGACDINDVTDALREADASSSIDTIILSVDSPGGNVSGIAEAAALFKDIGTRKKTGAYISGMGCSAAYYVACMAGEVVCEQFSGVGSIGVISARMDATAAMQNAGVKVHVFSMGDRKADGHPAVPMDKEESAARMAVVEQIYQKFASDVRAARPDVTDEALQSGFYVGPAALAAGLVDSLYPSLDAFAADMLAL